MVEAMEFVFRLLQLHEFGQTGMSRTVLVVYTGAMCVNSLLPLLLHKVLARQTKSKSIARWVRTDMKRMNPQ